MDEQTYIERQDEIARHYETKLSLIEQTRKTLGDRIKLWQNEQRKILGAEKNPKAKKSDPICQDFLQYQQLTKEYNELKADKKTKLDALTAQYASQQDPSLTDSVRGSKSLSPRKYMSA
jgi:hypothetical protein